MTDSSITPMTLRCAHGREVTITAWRDGGSVRARGRWSGRRCAVCEPVIIEALAEFCEAQGIAAWTFEDSGKSA